MRNLVIVSILVGLSSHLFAHDYRPGDEVVVIADAKLQIEDNPAVFEVWPGLVLKVEAINGDWLWVSYVKDGWLDQSNVIPLDRRAIDRFTEMIRRDPGNAGLYSVRADVWEHLGELDIAIGDHNEAIRLRPDSAAAYGGRGNAWRAKGEYDKAIDDYNQAIRLDPKDPVAYNNRGIAWSRKEEYDKAIDDYNQAIRLEPKYAKAYSNRGESRSRKGEYDKAIADYNRAICLNPKYAMAYNNLAWLRATCPDDAFRDEKQAVSDATQACELTGWRNFGYIDTLAAAYAEADDFPDAIAQQMKALDMAPENLKKEFRERLELYRAGKPYREK